MHWENILRIIIPETKKILQLIKEDIKYLLFDQIASIKAGLKSPTEVLGKYYLNTNAVSANRRIIIASYIKNR